MPSLDTPREETIRLVEEQRARAAAHPERKRPHARPAAVEASGGSAAVSHRRGRSQLQVSAATRTRHGGARRSRAACGSPWELQAARWRVLRAFRATAPAELQEQLRDEGAQDRKSFRCVDGYAATYASIV